MFSAFQSANGLAIIHANFAPKSMVLVSPRQAINLVGRLMLERNVVQHPYASSTG